VPFFREPNPNQDTNNMKSEFQPAIHVRRDGTPHFRTEQMYAAARAYRAAGLSFIPVAPSGHKTPYFELLPRVRDPRTCRPRGIAGANTEQ